jgi:hypothetical protein
MRRVQWLRNSVNVRKVKLRCSSTRGLTLPSRGRATSGFAGCRPPLMSNVRPRRMLRTTLAIVLRRAASQEAVGQWCRAAASALAEASHLFASGWRTVTARQEKPFISAYTATHERAQNECIPVSGSASGAAESKRWSVRGRRCSGSGEVGALTVTMVPSSLFRSRCRGISNSPASAARPNPSIEGTSNSKLRLPLAAPHVKR